IASVGSRPKVASHIVMRGRQTLPSAISSGAGLASIGRIAPWPGCWLTSSSSPQNVSRYHTSMPSWYGKRSTMKRVCRLVVGVPLGGGRPGARGVGAVAQRFVPADVLAVLDQVVLGRLDRHCAVRHDREAVGVPGVRAGLDVVAEDGAPAGSHRDLVDQPSPT